MLLWGLFDECSQIGNDSTSSRPFPKGIPNKCDHDIPQARALLVGSTIERLFLLLHIIFIPIDSLTDMPHPANLEGVLRYSHKSYH